MDGGSGGIKNWGQGLAAEPPPENHSTASTLATSRYKAANSPITAVNNRKIVGPVDGDREARYLRTSAANNQHKDKLWLKHPEIREI